ncbi:MAG TPA: bifunctional metallophosphatase/5'-nucleotidase [Caldithrix abyssi]|uniref:Bifunctional metallophosphatase/5'-nucleotidase n=1 Tax=Caldithrix abyssi TaxID=187145 RepID=A0A7V1PUN4_CALAY|nr:bifunctional metallophosphatase/5'-nucleotidase [Caldithrix abyssi]
MRFFVFLFFLTASLLAQRADTLYILQTTDVHGNIYPYDYFTDTPDSTRGLAKIYSKVVEYRQNHKNVLLVDCGDLIQGTPLVAYFNKHSQGLPHPMILTMNYMKYDAFAVGNHDIEQSLFVYNRAENESRFIWLSANSVMEDGGTYFKPYTVIERNGIKVGIIGLTTPGIPMWLDEELYPGITWQDMVTRARIFAKELRPQVDVLIGIFHAGFNAGYSQKQSEAAGIPNENASGLVAEQIPEFDAVFAGHSHRPGPMKAGKKNARSFGKKETLRLNAGFWAKNLGVARFIIHDDKSGRHITGKSAWLEPMAPVPADKAILQLTRPYHEKTRDYINTRIGVLKTTLDARESRIKDTALMDLINAAQLDYSGADISFAASFNPGFQLPPGPLRVKDVFAMYQYENFLYTLKMTGQQIKDFLEYSSRYYDYKDGKVVTATEWPGFNYDMAAGLRYEIDVRKPVGKRIINMEDMRGRPFDLNKTYTVAMNSYRASGGGGHMVYAHASKAPVIKKSNEDMRNILQQYIEKKKIIDIRPDNNWKVLP